MAVIHKPFWQAHLGNCIITRIPSTIVVVAYFLNPVAPQAHTFVVQYVLATSAAIPFLLLLV